ncbi:MAG: 30S ribosomal protein S19 [Candidatus Diapherotrites archaeon CG11_big_fil_rev_8_21_14_0_20_37_9]|nr:MAG: 30S ribosomal protein S19 [Candidatus Diapherotrites archaeon CG11_big_fil_rev_8_21_14_0_20_37_9]
MAKGDFTFRGKTVEELQGISLIEFSALCTARARRSIKRGTDEKFLKKIQKAHDLIKAGKYPKPVKTHYRDHVVLPSMIGATVAVYNGKEFVNVVINEKMLGHFLGEFVLTRKRLQHGKAGIGATRSSTAISARG